MNFLSFLTSAGAGILNTVAPGMGTAAAALINPLLSDDKKVDSSTASAKEILDAVKTLPPEQQSKIFSAKVDLEKAIIAADVNESNNFYANQKVLAELEAKGSHVRPIAVYTALVCMVVAIFASLAYQFIPVYYWASTCFDPSQLTDQVAALMGANSDPSVIVNTITNRPFDGGTCDIKALPEMKYETLLVILGLPTWIIQTYMGKRSREKTERQNAAMGVATDTTGILGKLASKIIK